jgi:hypothetical protein
MYVRQWLCGSVLHFGPEEEVACQFAQLRNALAARNASLTLILREGVSNPQLSSPGEVEGAVRARQSSGSSRTPTGSW